MALVTEFPEGHEDERKPRRKVKKIGIDPHFAYAWMLSEVAFARAYGTAFMLGTERPPISSVEGAPPEKRGREERLGDVLRRQHPGLLPDPEDTPLSCGDCENFDVGRNYCTLRKLSVTPELPECAFFIPTQEDEDEWD
ncbi:MAG: hypothetical protein HY271_07000 [Deltaproteobacteria bacterium]|nr:hypothetical protein [Deltaproteobacteria bacterium]